MAAEVKTDLVRLAEYVSRVQSGELPACEMVRLSVRRWLQDLERPDLVFDSEAFLNFTSFSRQFKHYKGEKAGTYFEPEDWQLFIAANVFGLKVRATGLRKYTYADVYVPRKNGKTMFAAIVANYLLLADGESGPEVYTAAVDQAQARLCFDASKELLMHSIFAKAVKPYQASVVYPAKAGVYKPLSKDTKNKDGLNPHAAICDERHAWPNNEIYDVVKTGMGARRQPLLFSISTAGTDTSVPYFADIETFKDIMRGVKQKDNHFIMLFCPDEGDHYDDPETWRKVNPNLGVSLSWTYMENECAEAKMRGGTYLAAFMTKNLNMWVDAPDVWISDDDVLASNNSDVQLSDLEGQECYVGIDLARKTDITAVALWFPSLNTFRMLFTVPEDKIKAMEDRVDYRLWSEQGWLIATPGNVLDEDWFMGWLISELDKYQVKAICYDPWGMWNILHKFGRYQSVLMEYRQDIRHMSVPTKWLESSVYQHKLNFMHNPVMRWMFKNVVVYKDPNENIKLDKARSRNKIDGVVAAVDALGGWLNATGGKSKEIYADHGLRVISLDDDDYEDDQ